MDRAELIALASPPCHHRPSGALAPECGRPVQRVEMWWCRFEGRWVPSAWFMVCAAEHRVRVDPA